MTSGSIRLSDLDLPGPLLVVVGPTASGKSDLAVDLAVRLGAEVVNADAMSLYRGMDIGTAKPTPEDMRGVAHHVFDIWEVTERANVVAYRDLARAAVDGVLRRGLLPVLVGGSGLYVRAVTDTLEFPGTDPAVRSALEADLERVGPAAMHERLAVVDPEAAAAILPGNGRRVVRALEVVTITGRPFTATLPERRPAYRAVTLGIDRSRPSSYDRIERRVHDMFDRGLVDEVRSLVTLGLRQGETASRALGYRQVLDWLDHGGSLDDVMAETVRATRRFARRQRSWFRRDAEVRWLDADSDGLEEDALSAIRNTIAS